MRDRLLTLAGPVLLLGLWEAASRAGWLNPIFFPAPTSILGTFAALIASGQLLDDTRASAIRVLAGFLLGFIAVAREEDGALPAAAEMAIQPELAIDDAAFPLLPGRRGSLLSRAMMNQSPCTFAQQRRALQRGAEQACR